MTGALEGTRIIEFANYVSGPFAGMLLADLGATVIKVEPPGTGDPFRGWGKADYNPTFGSMNRNKKSVTIDLKSPEGLASARRLVCGADVVIENFRTGTMDRLGLGYDAFATENPRLIYCSITGFGGVGPDRERPGYDTVGQAVSGLLAVLTDRAAPQPMGISLSDHLSGSIACYGIMAALLARAKTGRGQRVETSLLQATLAFLGENAANYFEEGRIPTRQTRCQRAQVYAFSAGDGLPFVIHLSSPPKFWEGLLQAIERPDLATDPRFASRPERIRNYESLQAELQKIFAGRSRSEWLARLEAADVPSGPLNTIEEVFADPQVQALGMRVELPHALRGSVSLVANPVRLSDTPAQMKSAAPLLGADNALLAEEL